MPDTYVGAVGQLEAAIADLQREIIILIAGWIVVFVKAVNPVERLASDEQASGAKIANISAEENGRPYPALREILCRRPADLVTVEPSASPPNRPDVALLFQHGQRRVEPSLAQGPLVAIQEQDQLPSCAGEAEIAARRAAIARVA